MIHIAGQPICVDDRLRQRCSWCGATLIDDDLTRGMVPDDQPISEPTTWGVGDLISREGTFPVVTCVVPFSDDDRLPDGCCARLDAAVTL